MDFSRHMAIQFRKAGEVAVYTPPTGPAIACHVMRSSNPLRFSGLELPVDGACFDLLRSEVTPERGGVLKVGDQAYPVDVPPVPFPLDKDPQELRWRLLCGWGSPVTYRTSTGNQAALNPPTGSGWSIAANAAAGASLVNIKAALTTGQLRAGDKAIIGGVTHTITANVSAVGNVFPEVALSPPLVAPVGAGGLVSFVFASDRPIRAAVAAYAAGQLLGGLSVGDQRLVVPHAAFVAAGVDQEPSATDSMLIGSRWRKIKTAASAWQSGGPILWELQVGS